MFKTLIIYSTTDGQTRKICERIMNASDNRDSLKIFPIEDVKKEDLSIYDNIIIGASIRYGKHNSNVYSFIKENKNILENKNTAFFTVNVVARKLDKNHPDTNPYMKKFLKITGWTPNRLAVFAGKIDYPKYKFFDKQIIRFIMYVTKGPTDISKVYEFTEWDRIDEFAKDLYQFDMI